MKRYIALLRGINISGKNKIAMADLRQCMKEQGFYEIVTYVNSGNVVFSSIIEDTTQLAQAIASIIKERYGFSIPVCVLLQEELKEYLEHAPIWWGKDDKDCYDNLVFLISPLSYKEFYQAMGEPNTVYEQVQEYKGVVFWSFRRSAYQKTNWWAKSACMPIANKITIRTARTIRKIANM